MVRTRRDAWKLDEWDPTLLWYAKAVAEMQTRALNDPTSWRYQAAIHEFVPGEDPNEDPGDVFPTPAEQQRFWSQCQHQSWFFLPWHRMYLSFFEQIVAATVKQLGGPEDWALPYWNYSDASNPNARKLPPAFIANTLPDGSPNALRVEARTAEANDGDETADAQDVNLDTCLKEESFISAPPGGDPGFGGRRTIFNHSGGPAGDVERVPHGSMHMAVGGFDGGWMSAFNTAGLDPIFWLHHCNIDRLWTVWLRRDPLHLNPAEAQWLTDISFEFNAADGNIVSMTSSQVIDTTASPLSYEYEDVTDPFGPTPTPTPGAQPMARRPRMTDRAIPEMVGATEQPVTLTGKPATTTLPVSPPTGPAAAPSATPSSTAEPKRIYLNLENITSSGRPGSYSVYLNVPAGDDPAKHPELYAGLLPMFGVAEATDATGEHPANGLHYTLDITDVVRTLEARNDWDPAQMRVSFIPKRRRVKPGATPAAVAAAAPPATPVQIGRVSVYYS
jgi:tyrosinase